MNTNDLPKTHLEAVRYFSDLDKCHSFLVSMRWPNGVECPKCGSNRVGSFSGKRKVCNCKNCKKQFTAKVGTIFEDSPLGLDLWFVAIWMVLNAKNGISSCEIGRALGIKQQSAWFVNHRIRYALENGTFVKMSGIVEIDESWIGSKARSIPKEMLSPGRRSKTIVMALLDRKKGRIAAEVLPFIEKEQTRNKVRKYVLKGSEIHSDKGTHYSLIKEEFVHKVVNHSVKYVNGNVHTNGIENFWSLLKRSIKGTYTFCQPYHLNRYLCEQVFRFNERHEDDLGRFVLGIKSVSGKRLMYEQLISKH